MQEEVVGEDLEPECKCKCRGEREKGRRNWHCHESTVTTFMGPPPSSSCRDAWCEVDALGTSVRGDDTLENIPVPVLVGTCK